MKSVLVAGLLAALSARDVVGHATFQQLWVGSTDMISVSLISAR
jgi:hypothetical protein